MLNYTRWPVIFAEECMKRKRRLLFERNETFLFLKKERVKNRVDFEVVRKRLSIVVVMKKNRSSYFILVVNLRSSPRFIIHCLITSIVTK